LFFFKSNRHLHAGSKASGYLRRCFTQRPDDGLYFEIHSPRIPSVNEMTGLLYVASRSIDAGKLWVNPDCGLKTRKWEEVKPAIENMVIATEILRKSI